MFAVMITFPPIKAGKDTEFREWFSQTNKEFANFKGFIGRKLLRPLGAGHYAAVAVFENQDDFKAMNSSDAHNQASERVRLLFEGNPIPRFYEVII